MQDAGRVEHADAMCKSQPMRASWKPMLAVIVAKVPTRSTGRCRNARRRRSPSDDTAPDADHKLPKVISPVDRW